MRNATVTCVAPTGTISIIADCSGGIEPLYSFVFMRHVLSGKKLLQGNPVFKKIAEKSGVIIETQLITGKPADEIIKFVREDDLIIMAHHDRIKGISGSIEKSVSREVVQRAPCSVLVLKKKT